MKPSNRFKQRPQQQVAAARVSSSAATSASNKLSQRPIQNNSSRRRRSSSTNNNDDDYSFCCQARNRSPLLMATSRSLLGLVTIPLLLISLLPNGNIQAVYSQSLIPQASNIHHQLRSINPSVQSSQHLNLNSNNANSPLQPNHFNPPQAQVMQAAGSSPALGLSSNYARMMQLQQAHMQAQCPVLASANPRIVGMQQSLASQQPPYSQQQQLPPINLEQVGGNCPVTKEGMLNVHIICHTHLDTGWVETFDQYYYGYVETIINSVVKSLLENPRRRFIFVETSFFMRWWRDQNEYMRSRFKKLVTNGQMEFISGGWSMNDEAVSHYSAVIDQMTLGHKSLYRLFGQCGGVPKIGWQIDPFGHSREYASLLSQMGFDGLFLGRIDFQDKMFRQNMQSMEFVWKSSPSLGAYKTDMFTCILPNTYSPPEQFCFDVNCNDEQLNKYNIQQKATHFSLMMMKQAESYATNHTLVTMGMDFHYRDANKWYTNLDMLVDEIQSNPMKYKINLVYSTPSCYLKNIHKQSHVSWPVKLDDFFPYADAHNSYWTGYFTSRPGLKYQIVMGNNFLQAAKQLSVLANPMSNQDAVNELEPLQETLGILQHHDAVTGTCKQFVNDDYSRMLGNAMKKAHHSLVTSVAKIIEHNNNQRQAMGHQQQMSPIDMFIMKGEHIFCSSLNASHCQISEKLDRFEKLLIHAYNPASHTVQHFIQIPVRDGRYIVRESSGNSNAAIASQQTPIPPSVLRLTSIESRQDYGVIDPEVSKEFIFAAILPPLTMATYVIEKLPGPPTGVGGGQLMAAASGTGPSFYSPTGSSGIKPSQASVSSLLPRIAYPSPPNNNNLVRREILGTPGGGDFIFGNSRISGIIDQTTGLLKAIQFADGRRLPFKQNFYYYDADGKYRPEKNSGAYIFNPSDRGAQRIAPKAEIEIIRGPVVEEVHQVFSPWCSQVIRIYKHSDYIEFHWLVGPIPIQADISNPNLQNGAYNPISDNGREIVSLYETDMKTNGTFFTDSNGRETIRRLRNHRSDYRLFTSETTASNYYPITSWIFIRDYDRNLQLTILPDRPQGGSSLHDGQVELMLHRRLLQDDGLGVEEPLNEPGIDRRGLIIRGKHYLLIGPIDSVIRSTRQLSKQLHMHPIQWFQAPPATMSLGQAPLISTNLLSSAGASPSASESAASGGANPSSRFKFSGLRDYLPKMINLLSLESWDQENVLIRLEHIFEINEDADYSRPVQVSLRRMFKNFKVVKVREMTLDALQDVEVARTNRLRFQTSTNPYKNYTDELGDFVNMDYVSHLIEGTQNGEDLFIVELRPMEIRTFLVQIHYI